MIGFNGDYREYKLDNGLHIILLDRESKTIDTALVVNFCALNEEEGEEGLAHLLEHSVINCGTKKYFSEEIKKIRKRFGYFGGESHTDKTEFPSGVLVGNFESYLDFISEIAFNPIFDAETFEQEKQRVLREIGNDKSQGIYNDRKEYRNALFGNHPVNHEILGKGSVIESATVENLKRLHAKGYNANNIEFYLVGKLPKNIDELIFKYFADKPTGKSTRFEFPLMEKSDNRVELYNPALDLFNQNNPKESNCQLFMDIIVPPNRSEYYSALSILAEILSENLHKSISEKKGLAYNISGEYRGVHNVGQIYINGNIISSRQQEGIDSIFEEFAKLRAKKVYNEELEDLKEKWLFGYAQRFETNIGNLKSMRTYQFYGETPKQIMEDYKAVTPEKILEAAQKFLPESREKGKYVMMVRDPLLK